MSELAPYINQVIHGNCINVLRSFPSECIDLVVADPPYLVNYLPRDGRRCLNDDRDEWLRPSFTEIARVLKHHAFCVSFYGWPWIERFMTVWKECELRPVSHLTWLKTHCSREGYTHSYHEVGYLLAKGKPPKPALPLRDVLPWAYTGNLHHPNEKPVVGIRPLIEAFSQQNDIVLDPFSGSGTTGLAAWECGRRFILIDMSAHHCGTARSRLSRTETHPKPVLKLPVRWNQARPSGESWRQ